MKKIGNYVNKYIFKLISDKIFWKTGSLDTYLLLIYIYCTIYILDDEVSAPQIYPIRADGSTGEGFILREGLFTPEGLLNENNGRMPLAEVRFPKLTSKQRKFAVNPGYMSYYNDDFAEIEDERDILGIYQFWNPISQKL